MKRTRKWAYVAQEAARLATLGLAPKEIAKRLGVNRSSVTRWMAAGKLGGKAPTKPVKPATKRKTPASWAAAVRKDYSLDETDDQLVTLAEQALAMSLDPNTPANVRMTAAGRFQAIVRQLALVARGAESAAPQGEAQPAPVVETPRPEPVRRADPRTLMLVAK